MRVDLPYAVQEVGVSRTVPVQSGAKRKSRWLHGKKKKKNVHRPLLKTDLEHRGKIHSTGTREITVAI